ncbi:aflatoxin efflux pump AFLT [Fusarium albosuccineum]|uniref:Aflatoxin efflux pump AFLT n=1 Tax=Fusarium albosuccineum TaxID=1237068 RepID=A0A8H4PF70_9HYPO|nr:aflatoxin efflux pump AFLT [Fusarium albosuccineum]
MSAPDYSMASTTRSQLSVRIPKESLYSTLMASSHHFHFDSETARLARDANQWLTTNKDSNGVSRPSSIAPSNFSVRSLPIDYDMPEQNRRDHPVMGSVRYNDRPRSAVPTESTEKLQSTPPDAGSSGNGDDVVYPTGMKLGLITLALCLAVFVMALDNSIIATAIPKITDAFGSLNDVGWYGSAYMLTTAALQLFFGKLYTYWSIKWTFLSAVAIFEVGSLICGAAPNSVTLIVGRAISGVGAAGIFAGALTILAFSVPLHRRPMYTGLISGMWGISSVAGPLLGGLFTDKVSWRWCFYINLPIGFITIVVIFFFFPEPERDIESSTWRVRFWQLDPIGTCIFMPAVVCLLLALQWGGIEYPWDDSRTTSLFMLAGFLLLVFGYVQYKMDENATVPPRIFKKRSVWAGAFFSFNTGACFLTALYFLPIWFQAVQGQTAIMSGVRNLPMLLGVVSCAMLAGAAVTTWGYYTPFMIAGAILMAVGFGVITTFSVDTTTAQWVGYQLIAGIGVGLALQQPLIAVQVVCEMVDIPTGTAMIVFSQTLGGALCVTVGNTVFTNTLYNRIREYVPGLDPDFVIATGATNIRSVIRTDWLDGVVQAYNDALTTSFYVGTATASVTIIGALLVEWRSVKGRNVEMAGGA